MLGDFLTRILILLMGYAYPGFECYKTVEKNAVQIEELRFWCQYWIIVALITVLERFTDIFVGWLPLYGEIKVAFFVYLWYAEVKGTGHVYQTVLRPIVSRHQNEIDGLLLALKAREWDLVFKNGPLCIFFRVVSTLPAPLRATCSKTVRHRK
ncbi:HVA22-like protein j isoform X2 [Prosopis cineraria]|uniref:HVA22-like protein j isoform X2 n=1 Tax=Prosopis cineraria TaxID=364024 RepID=UPI00240EB09F|nr:HVA22-like protein j isoform X2 [Prosopis cineraria]